MQQSYVRQLQLTQLSHPLLRSELRSCYYCQKLDLSHQLQCSIPSVELCMGNRRIASLPVCLSVASK